MNTGLFTRRSMSLGFALAALWLAPAAAAAATTTPAACSVLPSSQPFLAWSDSNWYSRVPGQTDANFVGTGWALTGGAAVVPTVRADGRTGSVLYLPKGSAAVSPAICVSSDYPTARTLVRNVDGLQGAFMLVSFDGGPYQPAGSLGSPGTSWTLSRAFNIQSASLAGWHSVRFKFDATLSSAQIYNFWVDPRMA
jgi:hypothetical protein